MIDSNDNDTGDAGRQARPAAAGDTGGPREAPSATDASPRDFFDWLRSLRIVRDNGWIGGVCAGIGARVGLDPLIVRGIAIVVAILGGPILIVYAIGWALLPDRDGRILMQELIRGRFEPAMIAVGLLVVLTFFPFMHGIWWQGPPAFWGMPGWLEVTLRVGWSIALVIGVVALIVWLATRPRGGYRPPASTDPHASTGDGPSASATYSASAAAGAAGFAARADESARRFGERADAWGRDAGRRADEWGRRVGERADEWGRRTGERVDQWGREVTDRANRAAAEWRSRQPGAGFVSIVLGLAVVVGAVAAAVVAGVFGRDIHWTQDALVIGVVAATSVIALGIVVSGIRGRTSGALGFFSAVGIAAIVFTAIVPTGSRFVPFGTADWSAEESLAGGDSGTAMIAGKTTVDLSELSRVDAGGTVDVWLGFGSVDLVLPDDLPMRVETNALIGNADFPRDTSPRKVSGMFLHNDRTLGSGSAPVTTVRVWNLIGNIDVTTEER